MEVPRGEGPRTSTADEKERYTSELQRWCATAHAREVEARAEAAVTTRKKERLSNMYWVTALDNAMKLGIGRHLSEFLPIRRLRPLGSTELRYFVADSELREGGDEAVRRACLWNSETKETEVEMPREYCDDGTENPPSDMVIAIDQGSIGHPCLFWLYLRLGLRGIWSHDPWHRIWNDLKLSLIAAGLWPVVREMTVVMNSSHGPFEGAAFFQTLKNAMGELHRVSKSDNFFFDYFYEGICQDWGQQHHAEFGTDAHRQMIWETLPHAPCFNKKGTYVKWSRWATFFDAGEEFRKDWSARLPAMYSFGFRKRWWTSLRESPLFGSFTKDAAVAAGQREHGGAQGMAGDAPITVKASNDAVKALRLQTTNTLHLACLVMSNPVTKRLFLIILECCKPVRVDMGVAMKYIAEHGAIAQLLDWSSGSYGKTVLASVMGKVVEPSVLRGCSFELPCANEPANEPAQLLEEEDSMADYMWRLVLAVTGQRALSMAEFTHGIPMALVRLLHTDAGKLSEATRYIKKVVLTLFRLEALACNDAWFRGFSENNLLWPQLTTVRELFITLQENDWELNECLLQRLRMLFGSMIHSKMAEELFNYLENYTRKSKSKMEGRLVRWRHATESPILGRWGYTQAPRTAFTDAQAPKVLPKAVFFGDSSDFSLGKDVLGTLSKNDWPSPSPASFALHALATQAMLVCSDDLFKLKKCWMSRLATQGMIIYKPHQQGTMGIVIHTSQFGCLCWPCKCFKKTIGDKVVKMYQPQTVNQNLWFEAITDPRSWRAIRCKVRSPLAGSSLPQEHRLVGIYLEALDRGPLIEVSALGVFENMLLPHLTALMGELKCAWTGRKPTTTTGVLQCLLRHVLPSYTSEQIDELIESRGRSKARVADTILTEPGNCDLAAAFLERDDVDALREGARRKTIEKERRPATIQPTIPQPASSIAASPSSSSGSSGSGATPPPARKCRQNILDIDWDNLHPGIVRDRMPAVPGLTVEREFRWSTRWRVFYPREQLPKSFSKIYSDKAGEVASVRACIRWAWEVHVLETGEEPPYMDDDEVIADLVPDEQTDDLTPGQTE